MWRTRLVWFTVGFSASAAAIAQFAWRDFSAQQHAISSDMKQSFDDLQARVLKLESVRTQNPSQTQVEGQI